MNYQTGINKIIKLLEAIDGTDIEEICHKSDRSYIGIRKNIEIAITEEDKEENEAKKHEPPKEIREIVSHAVGLFREGHPPTRKVLVKVGQKVNKGEKLGFIESMKLMKEIISPVKGIVSDKFVKSGDPVEYGQKLFEIEIV